MKVRVQLKNEIKEFDRPLDAYMFGQNNPDESKAIDKALELSMEQHIVAWEKYSVIKD